MRLPRAIDPSLGHGPNGHVQSGSFRTAAGRWNEHWGLRAARGILPRGPALFLSRAAYRTLAANVRAAVPAGVVTETDPLSCLPRAVFGIRQTQRAAAGTESM